MSDYKHDSDNLSLLHEVQQSVVGSLAKLPSSDRFRVLKSVAALLGIETSTGECANANGLVALDSSERAAVPDFSKDRSMSAKAFMLEKSPQTDVERIACLAYYSTHFLNMPHFKTVDLSQLNTEAAQRKFSNASVAVENAAKMGFLVPATKGRKQLSAAGEQYVQALPNRADARENMKRARPRRRVRRNASTANNRE